MIHTFNDEFELENVFFLSRRLFIYLFIYLFIIIIIIIGIYAFVLSCILTHLTTTFYRNKSPYTPLQHYISYISSTALQRGEWAPLLAGADLKNLCRFFTFSFSFSVFLVLKEEEKNKTHKIGGTLAVDVVHPFRSTVTTTTTTTSILLLVILLLIYLPLGGCISSCALLPLTCVGMPTGNPARLFIADDPVGAAMAVETLGQLDTPPTVGVPPPRTSSSSSSSRTEDLCMVLRLSEVTLRLSLHEEGECTHPPVGRSFFRHLGRQVLATLRELAATVQSSSLAVLPVEVRPGYQTVMRLAEVLTILRVARQPEKLTLREALQMLAQLMDLCQHRIRTPSRTEMKTREVALHLFRMISEVPVAASPSSEAIHHVLQRHTQGDGSALLFEAVRQECVPVLGALFGRLAGRLLPCFGGKDVVPFAFALDCRRCGLDIAPRPNPKQYRRTEERLERAAPGTSIAGTIQVDEDMLDAVPEQPQRRPKRRREGAEDPMYVVKQQQQQQQRPKLMDTLLFVSFISVMGLNREDCSFLPVPVLLTISCFALAPTSRTTKPCGKKMHDLCSYQPHSTVLRHLFAPPLASLLYGFIFNVSTLITDALSLYKCSHYLLLSQFKREKTNTHTHKQTKKTYRACSISFRTLMPHPLTFDRDNSVARDISQLIGNTPCVYLNRLNHTRAKIVLKLECENPMASVKDRLALAIIDKAEADGKLTPGKSVIVEATSGNTGVGLAHMAAIRGYKVIITMPESMSIERRCLLNIFGAEVHLTPSPLGMKGAVMMANKIVARNPNSVLANQFSTKYNAQIHEETTGPEIWRQNKGVVDMFVAGVGTGGTLTGVARYLKKMNPNVRIAAVEPAESPVLSGGKPGPHKIQGIGPGFIPEILDRSLIDEVFTVRSDDAIATAQKLARSDGIFAGFSSGANVFAALKIGERPEFAGKTIVTVIPSFGERYLSTALYKDVQERMKALPVIDAAVIEAK
eukprot:gene8176-5705_t